MDVVMFDGYIFMGIFSVCWILELWFYISGKNICIGIYINGLNYLDIIVL